MKRTTTAIVVAGLAASANAAPLSAAALTQQELLDYDTLAATRIGHTITLDDFPLEGHRAVDLELERFSVLAPGAQTIIVDADGNEHHVDANVALFRGAADGDPDSRVFVAVSPYGTHGFIRDRADLYAISSGPVGDALADLGVRVSNAATFDVTNTPRPPMCGPPQMLEETGVTDLLDRAPEGYASIISRSAITMETQIAIDTDYEFTASKFGGDANAASAYIQTLLGGVSYIYQQELGLQFALTYSRVFTSNNDPYPSSPADNRLSHFQSHWSSSMGSVQRDVAHMLTGLNPPSWGGRAYVSALCTSSGYGASAYINGWFPDPVQNHHAGNWDLTVMAHELGHNHGTGHTHDTFWYNPPIDRCGSGNCSGAFGGTLMSYCHTCAGGMINLAMEFDDRVKDNIAWYLDWYAPCVGSPTAIACPADCDANGSLNFDDIDCFVSGFLAGCD
ncbi:MAG: M12 family metallo-peptidase [Phycisphaerales bacterium]